MNNKLKTKKGITLIALIVTIIVLLILSGVTIVTLTGENGLFEKARLAKEQTEESKTEEQEALTAMENEIDTYNRSQNSSTPSNNMVQKKEGLSKFVDGNEGFTTTTGEVNFTSLGIKPKTYVQLDGDTSTNKYCKIASAQLSNTITLNGKFEIAIDTFMDNSDIKYEGEICVNFYKLDNGSYKQIAKIYVADAWPNTNGVKYGGSVSNYSIDLDAGGGSNTLKTEYPGGKWALIGDGSKIYLYREDKKLLEGNYTGEIQVDKIDIRFRYPDSDKATQMPIILRELYIGEPYYYKDILGE